jgi:hypothetical protein
LWQKPCLTSRIDSQIWEEWSIKWYVIENLTMNNSKISENGSGSNTVALPNDCSAYFRNVQWSFASNMNTNFRWDRSTSCARWQTKNIFSLAQGIQQPAKLRESASTPWTHDRHSNINLTTSSEGGLIPFFVEVRCHNNSDNRPPVLAWSTLNAMKIRHQGADIFPIMRSRMESLTDGKYRRPKYRANVVRRDDRSIPSGRGQQRCEGSSYDRPYYSWDGDREICVGGKDIHGFPWK